MDSVNTETTYNSVPSVLCVIISWIKGSRKDLPREGRQRVCLVLEIIENYLLKSRVLLKSL